jgi:hypothetical protein
MPQDVPVLPSTALTDRPSRLTGPGIVHAAPGLLLRLALPTQSVMTGPAAP